VSRVDVVLIAIEKPILFGIYRDEVLLEEISSDEMASDSVPLIFKDIMSRYSIHRVLFANGPGSFMAIKISYIFLKSLSILKDIELFSADGFFFNGSSPIRAFNKHYFVKRDGEIVIEKIEDPEIEPFQLPEKFESGLYSREVEPLYILPAV
jgi:hypothetical protein